MVKDTSWSSQTPRHSTPGSPRRGKNQPRRQRRPCCNGTHHLACRRFSAMTTEENSPMSFLGNSTDDWKRRTSPRHRITFRDIRMWRDAIAKCSPTSGVSKPESRHQLSRVITIPNRQSSPPFLYLVKVVSRIILVSSVVLLKIISQLLFQPVQPIPK